MTDTKLRVIRRHPLFPAMRLLTLIFILSICYEIFIFGTDIEGQLNMNVPLFQMIEVGLFTYVLITLTEILYAIILLLRWSHEMFTVYFDEITHQSGIIAKKIKKYGLKNIEHIFCEQSMLGRLFNFGTITLEGRFLKTPVRIKGITDPQECADFIKNSTILSQPSH